MTARLAFALALLAFVAYQIVTCSVLYALLTLDRWTRIRT